MLIGSRALSAARPALISVLITSGAKLSGTVAHPISFCNVLFIGNFCAALLVAGWFGIGTIVSDFAKLKVQVQAGLLINGCLATLLSALIFLGLQETSVTNAVLLGRIGPVLFAITGAVVLRKKIAPLEWVGFSLIAVGVLAIALKTSQYQANKGDILILLSTLVFALSALINQLMIAGNATLPVIVFSRNFLSATVFFFLAIKFFGPHHFADAFSANLWILMAVYSLVVIVAAQFLWYASLNDLDSRAVGRLTVLSPVFGVVYAFLINGERPSSIQVTTLGLVLIGVLIASLGKQKIDVSKTEIMAKKVEDVAT